jgi:RNA polymerase sigma-70 factor (ECF subfamily)
MQTYHSEQWQEWMLATLQGDQQAYRLLLTHLRRWLMAYFGNRMQGEAVEDLVQETLLTLHHKRQTFDPQLAFFPWIAAIAKHRWIDHLRKTLKYVETELDDDLIVDEPQTDPHAGFDLQVFLQQLPRAQAQVIELMKLQELSVQQVALQAGHSQASVKVMVHRGLKKMIAMAQEVRHDESFD